MPTQGPRPGGKTAGQVAKVQGYHVRTWDWEFRSRLGAWAPLGAGIYWKSQHSAQSVTTLRYN